MSDFTVTVPVSFLINDKWHDVHWEILLNQRTNKIQYRASVEGYKDVAVLITDGVLTALRLIAAGMAESAGDAQAPHATYEVGHIRTLEAAVEGESRLLRELTQRVNMTDGRIHAIERDMSTMRAGVQSELAAFRQMVAEALDRLDGMDARQREAVEKSQLFQERAMEGEAQLLHRIEQIEENDKRQSQFIFERLNALDGLVDRLEVQLAGSQNARILERLTTLSAKVGELSTLVSKLQAEHVSPAYLRADRDFAATWKPG